MVPKRYPAYARVFHPVSPDSWVDSAGAAGIAFTPTIQWDDIVRYSPDSRQLHSPRRGTLESAESETLAEVLSAFTSSPDECWFGVWEGWGDAFPPPAAVKFRWLIRDLHLVKGAVVEAPLVSSRGATVWWPADQSWFVATEVDYDSTIVAGSAAAIAAILSSRLCVVALDPLDTLTRDTP
ncbi:hypothetical protein [Rathayibacter rathayi]|uniref:hypothetical protein n=1 Tax=Rathayibacter rathayi TaxID=33887 RepID=UPI000FD72E3C|nr:hypothetical protein [Rathayibacter rathayi]MWV74599.1 hypothetical protein [Rathayibacter rathayi NCPPB 2980 = VKM Ac-1601]